MARIHFMERMNARGNQISIHYPAVHQLRSYHKTSCLTRHLLPFTEAVAARENTLPLYASMQSKQVKWVVESVQSVLQVGAE
jgi:dTDP-4-amino-4,6-dideoxygalactose transaminase